MAKLSFHSFGWRLATLVFVPHPRVSYGLWCLCNFGNTARNLKEPVEGVEVCSCHLIVLSELILDGSFTSWSSLTDLCTPSSRHGHMDRPKL